MTITAPRHALSLLSSVGCLALAATLTLACESGDSGDDSGGGGEGGASAASGGATGASGGSGNASGGSSSGGSSSGSGGSGSDECDLPYNGCAVVEKVKALAATYELTADVINSCSDLGVLVSSGTVVVTATLSIDGDTGAAVVELDDSEHSIEIDPTHEDFYPRDFSTSNPAAGRWYAYAYEWVENDRGYSEGFNLSLNEDLELANVDDGGQSYAVRVYTKNGCSIDFRLVE